jgi:hypothetical protein
LNGLWADDLYDVNGEDASMLGLEAGQAFGYSWQIADAEEMRCSELESKSQQSLNYLSTISCWENRVHDDVFQAVAAKTVESVSHTSECVTVLPTQPDSNANTVRRWFYFELIMYDCFVDVSKVCTAAEEPSYRTFDGQEFDFSGSCVYLLSATSSILPANLRPFRVYIENEKDVLMITYPEGRKTRSVTIEYASTTIRLEPHSVVMVSTLKET